MRYGTVRTVSTGLVMLLSMSTDALAKTRKITVTNTCTYTLWMAYFTSVGPQPAQKTGWEAAAGSTLTFEVEESWGGRIWARTNCDFTSDKPEYEQCETGGCVGGLECSREAGTGVIPVTLAEFNLQTGVDHYDTSNVDGFNVPIAITTNKDDCPLSNCPFDLNQACPDSLKKKNDKGETVGCLTDCGATLKDEYCCAGAHNLPETCPASGIPNYKWWKESCPIAYAYAYDESSGTALFVCNSDPDYVITFCPSDYLYDDVAVLPDGSTVSQGTVKPAATVAVGGSGGGSGNSGGATTPPSSGSSGSTSPTQGGSNSNSAASGAAESGLGSTPSSGNSDKGTGSSGGASSSLSPSPGTGSNADSEPAAEGKTGTEETFLGMPKTVAIGVAAAIVLILLGGIGYGLFVAQNKHRHGRGHGHNSGDRDDSDDEKGSMSSSASSDGEDDNRYDSDSSSDGGRGRRRGR